MYKKEFINALRRKGYKANYKNVICSTFDKFGYITLIVKGKDMIHFTYQDLFDYSYSGRSYNDIIQEVF